MNFPSWQPIDAALVLALLWIVLGLLALVSARTPRVITDGLFPVSALIALLIALTGVWAMADSASSAILAAGLPDLPFHVRVDALSGFFLLLLGGVSLGISLFSAGYFRDSEHSLPALCLQYHVFLASMAFVLIADDAYLFMIAWETMALSSYFLVTTEHHVARNRKAGFIYLLIAHLGAIAILLSFGALHVWLPEAHPAAPSPVSALMSGVMLKTAIYGMVRVIYDLIGNVRWEWGLVVLAIGAATTLFGVLYALMQHDLKRLLAYHSVENIG